MPPNPKNRIIEDKDASCRFKAWTQRALLGAHFLTSQWHVDLCTISEMNEFHKQIINESVIPEHEVDFNIFCKIAASQSHKYPKDTEQKSRSFISMIIGMQIIKWNSSYNRLLERLCGRSTKKCQKWMSKRNRFSEFANSLSKS